MENVMTTPILNCEPIEEFNKLLPFLSGVEQWTPADRASYFAFFCHGWYGRVNEAIYQEGEPNET